MIKKVSGIRAKFEMAATFLTKGTFYSLLYKRSFTPIFSEKLRKDIIINKCKKEV